MPARKPRHLKVLAGTLQRCRDTGPPAVELPVIEAVPAPPDWLPNAHAVKEWRRLAPILVANKLLTEAGLGPLAMLCALHGRLVQYWTEGEAPLASLVAAHRSLVNDFGLTPVAAGRVRPAASAAPTNRFLTNGRRS